MLKIRLSRCWKKNSPFYRVVLTDHKKPVKSWYIEILWWFEPLNHKFNWNIEQISSLITKWAKPSPRVAKLLFNNTKDPIFKSFFDEAKREWKTKKKKE